MDPANRPSRVATELAVLAAGLSLLALAVINVPTTDADGAMREAALRSQFPNLRLTETGHYSVLSDASRQEVRHVLQLLEELRTQFRQEFAPGDQRLTGQIRVVYFNSETDYRTFARQAAPALASSAGFFVAGDNRLAILNQASSAEFVQARQQVQRRQERLAHWVAADPNDRIQASTRLNEWSDEIASAARASTDRLIRHEGAHQLFHAYGLDSKYPVEPTWLTEGLAEYCEPAKLGAFHQPLAELLIRARDAGTLIPLTTLLNHRAAAGFFAFTGEQTEIAYAESWALTYSLLNGDRCDGFRDFVQHYRNIESPAAEQTRDVATVLAAYLHTDCHTLESEWETFINGL